VAYRLAGGNRHQRHRPAPSSAYQRRRIPAYQRISWQHQRKRQLILLSAYHQWRISISSISGIAISSIWRWPQRRSWRKWRHQLAAYLYQRWRRSAGGGGAGWRHLCSIHQLAKWRISAEKRSIERQYQLISQHQLSAAAAAGINQPAAGGSSAFIISLSPAAGLISISSGVAQRIMAASANQQLRQASRSA